MSAEPELDRLDRAVEFYDRCKGPSYGDAVNGVIGGARAVLARFGRRGPDGRSAPPSTDTAGDPNRWTAEVMDDDYGTPFVMLHDAGGGAVGGPAFYRDRPRAESLAAQINRPAPDPDLRSKIEAHITERIDALTAIGPSIGAIVGAQELRDVLDLLDAGEPPTGSGCA